MLGFWRSWTQGGTVAVGLAFMAAISCSAGGPANGSGPGTGQGDASGQAWLTGVWEGAYHNSAVASDSPQRDAAVRLEFVAEAGLSGKFRLDLTNMSEVYTEGSFADVAGKRLLLKITQSTLSALGTPGSARTLDYAVAGNSMELKNEQIRMDLIRKAADADSGNKPGAKSSPLLGTWRCADKQGRSWVLSVVTDRDFFLEIREVDRASLSMLGSVSKAQEAPPEYLLNVTQSRVSAYKGLEFKVKMLDEWTLSLHRVGAKPQAPLTEDAEALICDSEREST